MKFAFFLGRIHHALKLVPVMQGLQNAGHEIQVLIADNSINIDPATEYLGNMGIHQFHHARDYLMLSDDPIGEVDLLLADRVSTTVLYHNSLFWVSSSMREAAEDMFGFGQYLRTEKPDGVWALHENNFFAKILFYVSRYIDIPTYSLMEGVILEREERDLGKYSIGTQYTDILFSWSEADRQYYSEPDKIVPVGPTHLDEWLSGQDRQEAKQRIKQNLGLGGKKVVTFAPPRFDLYRGDPMRALLHLAEWTQNKGIALIASLHPFQGNMDSIRSQLSAFNHILIANDNAGSLARVYCSDVLVTQTATIGVEALILGVPVVQIDLDYVGIEQSMFGVPLIETVEEFDTLLSVEAMPLPDELSLCDGRSVQRIVSYIGAKQWVK